MRARAAALALLCAGLSAGCRGGQRPNLLVVTLDTTRADHLGSYGKAGAHTPNLDRLAAQGVQFDSCLTAVPITLPSHATLFTGAYPLVHGVRDNGLFRLPAERTTLAEVLKAHGYATGAAVGAFPLKRETGIAQGFDFFDDSLPEEPEALPGQPRQALRGLFFDERRAGQVNDAMLPWLRNRGRQPFFAWVHYWDAHQPLIPPEPFAQVHAHDLYQGEIAYVDQNLGVLLETLERQGLADRTVVAVLGDHGEGLGEHNEDSHSMLLYNSTLHVPFILKGPGLPAGRRVTSRVGTVDLLPTVLDLLGIAPPSSVQGRSLLPLVRRPAGASAAEQPYYAETLSPRLSYGWGEQRALFDGPYKYVHGPRPELFSLPDDPGERHDLSALQPERRTRMQGLLQAFLSRHASAGAAAAAHESSPETRERLAALGYLAGGEDGPPAVEETLRQDGTAPQDRVRDVNRWGRVKAVLSRRDFLGARELALPLVRDDPPNPFYRALLAAAHLGLGQLPAAARVAAEAPVVNAQNEAVFLEVARRLFAEGGQARARQLARSLADRHPSAPARYLLAEMEAQDGRAEQALGLLRDALQLDPRHRQARSSLAVRLAQLGQLGEAEREFRTLLEQHPDFAVAHLNYGTLLLKSGRSDEGLAEVRRAVELAPGYWKAHLALLAAHLQRNELAEADAVFRRIETSCPDRAIVQEARGLMGNA